MAVQTATFVFTDLVDSTAIASALSAVEADELRRTHLDLLRSEVNAAGGVEVKNLGDGLMVVFASASRALAAATGMQRAIDRYNRNATTPLSVRIGISAGEATAEDGDFFGDPVVEAARLCAAADGGQILCSQLVRALAGRHAATELVEIGALELKGLPGPVDTVEVRWEPDPVGLAGVPLPARLAPAGAERLFAFHGRAAERDVMETVLKRAAADAELHVVLLAGEPGIGKTALASSVARSAHASGWTVLLGSCTEGLGAPHEPWVGALGHLLAHRSDELGSVAPVHQGPIRRLLPHIGAAEALPAGADPTTERLLLHEAVRSLLGAASSEAPVVVVLDDIHWADVASLQLLEHLVRCREGLRVVLIATFRDSDVTADSALAQLLANLHRGDGVERIRLWGLSDDEVVELVEAAAGGALTDEGRALAHVVRRESGGNPFFLGELLRHLGEADLVVQDAAGRYSLRDGDLRLPTSVREVVGHRVGRLGDETKRLLSIAAVIGREFDVALLAEVAEVDEGDTLDVLERARAAAIVAESPEDPDRFRFSHALVAHTLEAELGGARRRRIHERVAVALEGREDDSPGELGELARHWLAAVRPTNADRALHGARRAGDAALAALAPADACHWYEQALELVASDDRGERCRLLTRLATARWQAAHPQALAALLEASRLALDLGDPELLVGVSLAVWDTGESQREARPERVAVIEAALRTVSEDHPALEGQLLARLAEALDPRDPRRFELAERAIARARSSGDRACLLNVLIVASDPRTRPDNLGNRLDDIAVAVDLALRSNDLWTRAQAMNLHVIYLLEAARIEEGEAVLRQVEALAEETGLSAVAFQGGLVRTALTLLAGDLTVAERAAEATFALGTQAGASAAGVSYGVQLLEIREQQGRVAEVIDFYEDVAKANPTIAAMRARIAELYCQLGRTEEAAAVLAADAADGFAAYPFNITWLGAMGRCAEAATELRDERACERLQELLAPYAGSFMFNVSAFLGPVARPLGRLAAVLGDPDRARHHFEAALSAARRLQAPYLTARVIVDAAELADVTDATWIDEARALSDRYGYGRLTERLEALGVG